MPLMRCELCPDAIADGAARTRFVDDRLVTLCPRCANLMSERSRHPPPRMRFELFGLMSLLVACIIGSFVVVFLG